MISVIVPVYNVEKHIQKCVTSICNQSYKDIEIILVDDGSTDRSGTICDELQKENQKIQVVHKVNGGLSSARNAGIDVAKGDYYGFIDSDDYIEKEMFGTLFEAITRTGKEIACCGRIVDIFGQYSNVEFTIKEEREFSREEAIKEVLLLEKIDVSACDKLYDKKIFKDIRYPEGKISEDAAIIFDIIEKSNGMVHVGRPFYHYVFRNDSITKSKYNEKRYDVVGNMFRTKNFIIEKYPNLIKYYNIYSTISASALLLDMDRDRSAKIKYPEHYIDYRELFNDGFKDAVRYPGINIKMKVRLLSIKSHLTVPFFLLKGVYAFYRKNLEKYS